jgi:hypothetical protein
MALLSIPALVVSCHRRSSQPAIPAAISDQAQISFEAGEERFEAGDYPAAVRSYEDYLHSNATEHLDRVHFRLAIAYSLEPENLQRLRLAKDHFQYLAIQFPKSQYRAPADLILALLDEIEKLSGDVREQQVRIKTLTDELLKLKAIDLKQNPSRPPG